MLNLLSLLKNSSQYLFTVNALFPPALFQYKVAFKMENDISCAELTDSIFFLFLLAFLFFYFFLSWLRLLYKYNAAFNDPIPLLSDFSFIKLDV